MNLNDKEAYRKLTTARQECERARWMLWLCDMMLGIAGEAAMAAAGAAADGAVRAARAGAEAAARAVRALEAR